VPDRTLIIVSDLHLGGAPASAGHPGFQMCPVESRRRLVALVERCGKRGDELVIAGDFIDFLAEERPGSGFAAFREDPEEAVACLWAAMAHADEPLAPGPGVFGALAAFVKSGGALTLLLGNHDLELCVPPVHQALVQALTGGAPARLTFLYDNQALCVGDLIVEHGNRYDGWNQVMHDGLRRFRSQVSRGEPASFGPPPGSKLVVRVMNDLKQRFPFVDLLKPEEEGVAPILAALEPKVLSELRHLAPLKAHAWVLEPKAGGVPRVLSAIAADPERLRDADQVERAIAAGPESAWAPAPGLQAVAADKKPQPGALRTVRDLWQIARMAEQDPWSALHRALVRQRESFHSTFDPLHEQPRYLEAARRLAGDQPKVVVFGHTHLAKDIPLNPVGGRYLNTGTWCPVIRLPDRFTDPAHLGDATVEAALEGMVRDFREGRQDAWVQLRTTFARVVVGPDGAIGDAGVFEWDGQGETPFAGHPA